MNGFTKLTLLSCVLPIFVAGCGGGGSSSNDAPESLKSVTEPESVSLVNVGGRPTLKSITTYRTTQVNPSAAQVLSCATLFIDGDSCAVADIKPIGAATSDDVSIEDIKSRLVVSHDWMAESFIAALVKIDDQDLLNLFKPINTIVLSYDIRPSFYHGLTASIYIDPRYLWRDSDEWQTIYQQNDYRDAYQSEFTYSHASRYLSATTNGNVTSSNSYHASYYNSRSTTMIAPGLFRLLAHELAHANDYLPSSTLTTLDESATIYENILAAPNHISDDLHKANPLNSELLYEVAQILFQGDDMTERVRDTPASTVGYEFADDGASDFYSYLTGMEDVAMLSETFMMYKKYGAVKDVALVTLPTTEYYGCDDYLIAWGEKNRLADDNVKQRAILVASALLGRDVRDDLASIASQPTTIEAGRGWCESQDETSSVSSDIVTKSLRSSPQVVHDYRDDFVQP